ncbi:hypothetical protein IWZ03DRAFT_378121 [Phyllosticta citriasiana]|uniref:Secreted protein n=1 Tax=Phyllosticta citriasiana TaxID=595635 RepID=A0ABR1KK41_9PEZI
MSEGAGALLCLSFDTISFRSLATTFFFFFFFFFSSRLLACLRASSPCLYGMPNTAVHFSINLVSLHSSIPVSKLRSVLSSGGAVCSPMLYLCMLV